jgi:hypothetical protein
MRNDLAYELRYSVIRVDVIDDVDDDTMQVWLSTVVRRWSLLLRHQATLLEVARRVRKRVTTNDHLCILNVSIYMCTTYPVTIRSYTFLTLLTTSLNPSRPAFNLAPSALPRLYTSLSLFSPLLL